MPAQPSTRYPSMFKKAKKVTVTATPAVPISAAPTQADFNALVAKVNALVTDNAALLASLTAALHVSTKN